MPWEEILRLYQNAPLMAEMWKYICGILGLINIFLCILAFKGFKFASERKEDNEKLTEALEKMMDPMASSIASNENRINGLFIGIESVQKSLTNLEYIILIDLVKRGAIDINEDAEFKEKALSKLLKIDKNKKGSTKDEG